MNVRANVSASKPVAKPPFRAEHIGSLLRPAELMAARAGFSPRAVWTDPERLFSIHWLES